MMSRSRLTGRRGGGLTILALALLLAVGGCREYTDDVRELPLDGEELPILRQSSGVHSHETRAMKVVVRDAATLARIPIEDVPVDFTREMLLIVTLGRVTSDQYRVAIDRVWREGPTLRVRIVVTSPPPGAPLAMASPFCIAVVPRCDLNVAGFAPEPPERVPAWQQSPLPERW
jgi:hypothetical protein